MNKRINDLKKELNFYDTDIIITPKDIKNKVNHYAFEKNLYKKQGVLRTASIAFAVFIFLTVTTVATVIQWDTTLLEWFKPSEKMIEYLSPAVNLPMVTDEDNGVKVMVKQTIADNHGLYILYEIEAPNDFEFNEDIVFEYHKLNFDIKKTDKPRLMSAIAGTANTENNGNKRTVLYRVDSSGQIANGHLSLELSDLGYWKWNEDMTDAEFITLLETNLSLKWEFSYESTSKLFTVNKPVKVNTVNKNVWTVLEVSPVSIWLQVEGDDILTGIIPIVKFKDGTEIIFDDPKSTSRSFANNLEGDNKKGTATVGCTFDNIVDISQIESITIGDVTVFAN